MRLISHSTSPISSGYRKWQKYTTVQATITKNADGVKTGLLWKYLKDTAVNHCPADQPPYPLGSMRNLTSYLMNSSMCSDNNADVPVSYKITKFRTRAVMFLETREDPAYWNDGSNYPNEGIPNRPGRAGSSRFATAAGHRGSAC